MHSEGPLRIVYPDNTARQHGASTEIEKIHHRVCIRHANIRSGVHGKLELGDEEITAERIWLRIHTKCWLVFDVLRRVMSVDQSAKQTLPCLHEVSVRIIDEREGEGGRFRKSFAELLMFRPGFRLTL